MTLYYEICPTHFNPLTSCKGVNCVECVCLLHLQKINFLVIQVAISKVKKELNCLVKIRLIDYVLANEKKIYFFYLQVSK